MKALVISHALAFLLVSTAIPTADAAESGSGVGLKLVADGFAQPLNLVPFPDKSGRVLIGDQPGIVYLLAKDAVRKVFMDIHEKLEPTISKNGFDERGLLGLALHPQFLKNHKLYAFYSAPHRANAPTDWNCVSRVSEFKAITDFSEVDPASERILLEFDKPEANHNCGRIAFGPDGFLYIGTGDGGDGNDNSPRHLPGGNSQNLTTLLGKILRIDVDHGDPYGIPKDNPFLDGKGRPEIFAYGVRNPWGISFDRGGTHQLFAADVGQSAFEEVNIIVKGGNYGWNLREGFHGFDPSNAKKVPAATPTVGRDGSPLIDPILEYKNFGAHPNDPDAKGCSITGGYVYRGKAIPQLQGKYIFGDWSRNWGKSDGEVFVASPPADGSKRWTMEMLDLVTHPGGVLGVTVVAFGESLDGEIYVLTNETRGPFGATGKVFKIVPMAAPNQAPPAPPKS